MNLNDLRSNAYSKGSSTGSQKDDSKSSGVVKPFMPKRISREEMEQGVVVKTTSEKSSENSSEKLSVKKSFSSDKDFPDYNTANKNNSENQKKNNAQTLDDSVDFLKSNGLLKVPVEESKEPGKDSVYRRVAKFLLIIGEAEAAKILPHLSEKQIEKIIPEIASIRSVGKDEAAVILEEFNSLLENARKSGGVETAREMLIKAYGKDRADEMIRKTMPLEGKKPFDYLNEADCEKIYLLLKDENVGVQSMVLSHLEPKKAAGVINIMKDDEKKSVVLRLAKMEPISPEILRRVDQAMHEKSLNLTTEQAENIDGRNALAQILKKMDSNSESEILSTLAEEDPDLGQDLRGRLFTIDDVVKGDDRFIQERLREMDDKDICLLLAGKPDDFREKILFNVSAGRRAEIREQESINSPFRRSDCEAVTSRFFSVLRRAYEEGKFFVEGRSDEIYV